ncbi:hypothetical protein C8A03DRAFT_37485 [Achaetomium macrosporum]|uniref:Uncharacterized protein n=1 Tax=Achaetomium macrosporum TaxID=79813 RepID=A0AAN7H8T2_9PEZI|nr:hypothetical protein C8A03DRAFT_37485 [Achaetomium macrosporum]
MAPPGPLPLLSYASEEKCKFIRSLFGNEPERKSMEIASEKGISVVDAPLPARDDNLREIIQQFESQIAALAEMFTDYVRSNSFATTPFLDRPVDADWAARLAAQHPRNLSCKMFAAVTDDVKSLLGRKDLMVCNLLDLFLKTNPLNLDMVLKLPIKEGIKIHVPDEIW